MRTKKGQKMDRINYEYSSLENDQEYEYGKKKTYAHRDPLSHRIIEKRRRDRMNTCLANLNTLIPPYYLKKGRGRVEKTEIIEMAIKYMKNIQAQQDPQKIDQADLEDESNWWLRGYQEAIEQALLFLVDVQKISSTDSLYVKLSQFLSGNLEKQKELFAMRSRNKSDNQDSRSNFSESSKEPNEGEPKPNVSGENIAKESEVLEGQFKTVKVEQDSSYEESTSGSSSVDNGYYSNDNCAMRSIAPKSSSLQPLDKEITADYPVRDSDSITSGSDSGLPKPSTPSSSYQKDCVGEYDHVNLKFEREAAEKREEYLYRKMLADGYYHRNSSPADLLKSSQQRSYSCSPSKKNDVDSYIGQFRDRVPSPISKGGESSSSISTSGGSYTRSSHSSTSSSICSSTISDDHCSRLYKFKSNMKERYSQNGYEVNSNHKSAVKESEVVSTHCRDSSTTEEEFISSPKKFKSTHDNPVIDDESNSSRHVKESFKSFGKTSHPVSSSKVEEKCEAKFTERELPSNHERRPSPVPIFAFNQSGSFYVPMSVDPSVVSSALLPKSSFSPVLHPVSIFVNFSTPIYTQPIPETSTIDPSIVSGNPSYKIPIHVGEGYPMPEKYEGTAKAHPNMSSTSQINNKPNSYKKKHASESFSNNLQIDDKSNYNNSGSSSNKSLKRSIYDSNSHSIFAEESSASASKYAFSNSNSPSLQTASSKPDRPSLHSRCRSGPLMNEVPSGVQMENQRGSYSPHHHRYPTTAMYKPSSSGSRTIDNTNSNFSGNGNYHLSENPVGDLRAAASSSSGYPDHPPQLRGSYYPGAPHFIHPGDTYNSRLPAKERALRNPPDIPLVPPFSANYYDRQGISSNSFHPYSRPSQLNPWAYHMAPRPFKV